MPAASRGEPGTAIGAPQQTKKPKPPFDARRPCWFLTKWRARPDGSVKRGLFKGLATGPAAFPRSSRSAALRHALRLCRRAPAGLVLEMDVCQRGSVAVADDGQASVSAAGQGGGKRRSGRLKAFASAVRSAFWSDRSASPGHSVWVSSGELSRGREGVKALSPEL